jgi:hypothetical protein
MATINDLGMRWEIRPRTGVRCGIWHSNIIARFTKN